jgi:hypothetical protein
MNVFLARRPLLIGLLLLGLGWIACDRLVSPGPEAKPSANPQGKASAGPKPANRPGTAAPRSAQGLMLDARQDVSADARPPDARRESIIRAGLGELQEMKQMNLAVFDDAAKRWNEQPRVKEIIAQWKELEEVWKTQGDEAKAAVVPRMEAMWKEAIGLLREEFEKSVREADAGVK